MSNEPYILDQKYSSKIILLGEYGVIHGGEILASPLIKYSAKWIRDNPIESIQKELFKIYNYLISKENKTLNLNRFKEAINDGFYLKSNIPSGYGLGSSGSISAAIYDAFAYQKATDLDDIKKDLIDIESCFHGVSSGIDPLVIYLNASIHIDHSEIKVIDQSIDLSNYFLIDTHVKRKTAPLVDQYLERAKNAEYSAAIEIYKSLNRRAIQAQLNNNTTTLRQIIAEISQWQYEYLDFAILDQHKALWRATLNRSDISLKHCGAGGGGFIMGYSENINVVKSEFDGKYDLIPLG